MKRLARLSFALLAAACVLHAQEQSDSVKADEQLMLKHRRAKTPEADIEIREALDRFKSLGAKGGESAHYVLMYLRSPQHRQQASDVLVAFGPEWVAEAFLPIDSRDEGLRDRALREVIDRLKPEVLAPLLKRCIQRLGYRDEVFRELFASMGEPALKALLRVFDEGKRDIEFARTIRFFGAHAEHVLPRLHQRFESADPTDLRTRAAFASAIAGVTRDAAEGVRVLLEVLSVQSSDYHGAVEALARTGVAARPAVSRLKEICQFAPAETKLVAARMVWGLTKSGDGLILPMAQLLTHHDEHGYQPVLADAIALARKMRSEARVLTPILIDIWADKGSESEAARIALGSTGIDVAVVPRMVRWIDTGDENATGVARGVLNFVGTDPALLATYTKRLHEDHPESRTAAALALLEIGGDLRPMLPDLIEGLIARLGEDGDAAVPALREACSMEDRRTRMFALWGLASVGKRGAEAVPELRSALQSDDDGIVQYAAQSVRVLKLQSKSLHRELKNVLKTHKVPTKGSLECAYALFACDTKYAATTRKHWQSAMPDDKLRPSALTMLGRLGKYGRPSLRLIREHMDRKHDPKTIGAAAVAHYRVTKDIEPTLDVLKQLLTRTGGWTVALDKLTELGPAAKPIVEFLRDARTRIVKKIDDENLAALDAAIRSIDPPKPKKRAKGKKK